MGVVALSHRFDKNAFYFPLKLLNVMLRSEPEGPLGCIKTFNEACCQSHSLLAMSLHQFTGLSQEVSAVSVEMS